MSSRSLEDLDGRFRPLADQLLAQSSAAGIPLRVINTLRTQAEQDHNILIGVSWTTHSLHLPQPPDGKSLAIDVCPAALLHEKGWAPGAPEWQTIGVIGEALGLRWGGRWKKQLDLGHFEMILKEHHELLEHTV